LKILSGFFSTIAQKVGGIWNKIFKIILIYVHNIAFEALYSPFISPNLAALLIGQSLEAGLIVSDTL